MKKQWNTLWEILIYTGLIFLISSLLVSGKAMLYLHPKMIKYLVLALIILVIIDVYWISKLIQKKVDGQSFRYSTLLFLLPFIAAMFNPGDINGAVLQNKTVNIRKVTTSDDAPDLEKDQVPAPEILEPDITSSEQAKAFLGIEEGATEVILSDMTEAASMESEASVMVPVSEVEISAVETIVSESQEESIIMEVDGESVEVIVIDDYWSFLVTLGEDGGGWIGKTVVIEGFVFRDEGYRENTVVLSRLVMSCCAADAYVAGVYVKGDEVSNLQSDSWVRITGIITEDAVYNPYMDDDSLVPLLVPEKIESIDAYENPYIYPQ